MTVAQSHHRCSRHPRRPCPRRQARLRRHRGPVRRRPRSRASTCAAAGRARARPRCSIRRRRSKASMPSCCRAARPSGSMPPPARRPTCASRAAASRCARRGCRSCRRAILFDLLNGGDKNWGRYPPYRELGYDGGESRRRRIRARQRRRGTWRHHRQPQRRRRLGLGGNARRHHGRRAGGGQCRRHDGGRRRSAFLGGAVRAERRIRRPRLAGQGHARRRLRSAPKAARSENTTLAVVATDAKLTKAQCNRLAVMAQDGLARAIYPVHTPLDGDVVFAAATGDQAARRSVLRSRRTRHGRRQCDGARHRPRRL